MTIAINPTHSFAYGQALFLVYLADKEEGLPRHEHTISHAVACTSGSCIIRKEGREKVIDKHTQPIDLVANEWHEIEALEDGTVFINIFANEA